MDEQKINQIKQMNLDSMQKEKNKNNEIPEDINPITYEEELEIQNINEEPNLEKFEDKNKTLDSQNENTSNINVKTPDLVPIENNEPKKQVNTNSNEPALTNDVIFDDRTGDNISEENISKIKELNSASLKTNIDNLSEKNNLDISKNNEVVSQIENTSENLNKEKEIQKELPKEDSTDNNTQNQSEKEN